MKKVEFKKISRKELDTMIKNNERFFKNIDFSMTDLIDIELTNCEFENCNFRNSKMIISNFSYSSFTNCNFDCARMKKSNFSYSNFENCSMKNIDICGTDFTKSDLIECEIKDFYTDEDTKFFALQCPEEGSFIGWKKADNNYIVKLLIPEDAKRSSASSRKCRCSKAKVLEIIDLEFGDSIQEVKSNYNSDFIYKVGETVEVKDFDKDRWKECAREFIFLSHEEKQSVMTFFKFKIEVLTGGSLWLYGMLFLK